jgi:hypothetical protein
LAEKNGNGKKAEIFGVDVSLLTDEEIKAIGLKVEAAVKEEKKKVAMKALEDAFTKKAKEHVGLAEPSLTLTVNLAPFANHIMIDGLTYFHGQAISVPLSRARDILSQQARTWDHQAEIEGKNKLQYRTRGVTLSGKPVGGLQV